MPHLMIFAPCENVIIGEDKALSLINIFHGAVLRVDLPVQESTAIPLKWKIVSMWYKLPSEADEIEYEQRAEIINPYGERAFHAGTEFKFSKISPFHKIIIHVDRFPVNVAGQYLITVSIKEKSVNGAYNEAARTFVRVEHKEPDAKSS